MKGAGLAHRKLQVWLAAVVRDQQLKRILIGEENGGHFTVERADR
jgi:hypothetical protein